MLLVGDVDTLCADMDLSVVGAREPVGKTFVGSLAQPCPQTFGDLVFRDGRLCIAYDLRDELPRLGPVHVAGEVCPLCDGDPVFDDGEGLDHRLPPLLLVLPARIVREWFVALAVVLGLVEAESNASLSHFRLGAFGPSVLVDSRFAPLSIGVAPFQVEDLRLLFFLRRCSESVLGPMTT